MSEKEQGGDYINLEILRTTEQYKRGLVGSLLGAIEGTIMRSNLDISTEALEALTDIIEQKVVDLESAKKFCEDYTPKIQIDFDQLIKQYEEHYLSAESSREKLRKKLFPEQTNKGKIN